MRRAFITGLVLCAAAVSASAQQTPPPGAQTVVAVPGERYDAGLLKRAVFGGHYRRLWTTPIRVEVLDVETFSGGLTVGGKGSSGGKQTKSVRFKGKDGREWKVRSVDKDPSAVLPEELRDTVVDNILQDQISAALPTGSLVVDGLAKAAGILHVERKLVVLPDHPALGEFRKDFAGMLGILEEDPSVKDPVTPGFEGLSKPLDTDELWERLDKHPEEAVDARAYLYARLFDLLIGDFDRHNSQWEWTRTKDSQRWLPLPKDRDQAFARFNGVLLAGFKRLQPALVEFDAVYPDMVGLTWQARFLDRRHLAPLTWPDWQVTAAALQSRLTDEVIAAAVRRLPAEHYAIEGETLALRLRARRDKLQEAAQRFYVILAKESEIELSDTPERVEATHNPDGSVRVRVVAVTPTGDGPVTFDRAFHPADTAEVRVLLKGGNDQAVATGGPGMIQLRFVGGPGDDVLDDSAAGRARLYDHEGNNRFLSGPGTREVRTPWLTVGNRLGERDEKPMRDWGRSRLFVPWLRAGGGVGVLVGGALQASTYGFRKVPHSTRHTIGIGYATALQAVRAEYRAEYLVSGSPRRTDVRLRFSEIDLLRFHGYGNDTVAVADDAFYQLYQRQYSASVMYRLGLTGIDLSLGPILKYQSTDLSNGGFIAESRPYGADHFGQVGGRARLMIGRTDDDRVPQHPAWLRVMGSAYPGAWDVDESFGSLEGEAGTMLRTKLPLRPALALKVGAKSVFGTYPFHEAAFIGGSENLRGLRPQRYAGDSAAWVNADLRFRLGRVSLIVPTDFGVFGLADAGRVWVDGESSDTWHTGVGGGIWLSFVDPANSISFAAVQSEGQTRIYVAAGFGF